MTEAKEYVALEAVASNGKGRELWGTTHENYGTGVARRPHHVYGQCRELPWSVW